MRLRTPLTPYIAGLVYTNTLTCEKKQMTRIDLVARPEEEEW